MDLGDEGGALGRSHAFRQRSPARCHGLPVHRAHAVGKESGLRLVQSRHGAARGAREPSSVPCLAPGRKLRLPPRRALLQLRGAASLQGEVRAGVGAQVSRGARRPRSPARARRCFRVDCGRDEGAVRSMSPWVAVRSMRPCAAVRPVRWAAATRILVMLAAGGSAALAYANDSATPPASTRASSETTAAVHGGPSSSETTLIVRHFGSVTLYRPAGTPRSVAIFVSGDGGWNLGVVSMARSLAAEGAVVIGVDVRQYLRSLRAGVASGKASCQL